MVLGVDVAITFNAAGTGASATGANITPGLPAGFVADDIHVLVIANAAGTLGGLTGWTQRISFANLHQVWWRRAVGGDTAPTITGATGDIVGRIFGFRGCSTSGDPFDASDTATTASSTTVNAPAITTLNANSMILFAVTYRDFASTTSLISGWSGTNPTFADGGQTNASLTDNVGVNIAYGIKTDVSTTGARTATLDSAPDNNWGSLLALREQEATAVSSGSLLQYGIGG